MRYPEQSLTENEEKQKGGRESELKGWIYIGMNLYRDETKKVMRRREKSLCMLYTCICRVRVKEREAKASVWKQKEQWETKRNSRISHSSTYGRVVSQSHCCATPQEYEWASSPHFIIFFRLCVSEVKQGEERRTWGKREIKVAQWFSLFT